MSFRQSFLLCLLILEVLGCTRRGHETWKVLMVGSIPAVQPTSAHSERTSYALRQTHEPIFRLDENHQVVSRVLSTWKRSEDYTSFTLCPNTALEFEPGKPLAVADIEASIERTWKGITEFKTEGVDGCALVHFSEPRHDFFRALMSYSASPTRATENPQIDVGLGPFKVESLAPEEVTLIRKKPDSSKRFDRVVFKNIVGRSDNDIDDRSVQEFNPISRTKQFPEWVYSDYAKYPNSQLEIMSLIINVPDIEIRKRIYNCIDIKALREAYGHAAEIRDIGSLLPIGMAGAKTGQIAQNCDFPLVRNARPLSFINPKPAAQEALKKVFQNLTAKTGIPIVVQPVTYNFLAQHYIETHSGYDLGIVAVMNEFSDLTEFLEVFADSKKMIHSLKLPELNKKFDDVKNTVDETKHQKLGLELNDEILKLAVAVPLMQPVSPLYYPKDIKLPRVGSSFTTAPEVDGIE